MIFQQKIKDTDYTIIINFKTLEIHVFYKYGSGHEKLVKVDLFGHLSIRQLSKKLTDIRNFYKNM